MHKRTNGKMRVFGNDCKIYNVDMIFHYNAYDMQQCTNDLAMIASIL